MGKHDDRPQGCSCHTCAPCSFCTSLTEEEADIAWNGGSDAVWAYRRQKETEEAERHLAIRELDEMTPHMKHLMENQLSVREAKVVAVMARTGATSPKEIGKAARIWQSNYVASLLGRLLKKNVLKRTARARYEFMDPNLEHWLKARMGMLSEEK